MSKFPVTKPSIAQIVDLLPEPFVIIDREYRIVEANQRYCDHYGVGKDQIVGRNCHQVSHHSDVPCHHNGEHCPMLEVYRSQSATHVVHVHYDRDGNEERVQLNAVPIADKSGKIMFMGESIVPLEDNDMQSEDQIVGRSGTMLRTISMLQRVAPTSTTVLLEGESGSGKECAAQYIHRYSSAHEKPFVVLDCTLLDENSLERELFGAVPDSPGLICSAEGGTLYLDQICELPMSLQTRLLRFIETSTYRPVGGSEYRTINVRLIASTTRPLMSMVEQGAFRNDLYFRLSTFPVRIPPLRDRIDDIPLLAECLLKRLPNGARHVPLSVSVIERLLSYDYPGNVRELRNILERAVVLAGDEAIMPEHLLLERVTVESQQVVSAKRQVEYSESELRVLKALMNNDGNRARTARSLGISERTVYRHVRKFRGQMGENFLQDKQLTELISAS